MKVYEAIKLIPDETLRAFVKAGLISINTQRDVQIYEKVQAYMQTGCKSFAQACLNVEALLGREIEDKQIYRIYKKLDCEI